VAGVGEVWVASPRPTPEIMAAAAIAGADALLAAGGAHAIAALAFGAGAVPACDAVVGPGNRWVTAAKQLVAGRVAIDMLAGPSELVALADETADPALVAADLLAQAEHDPDALPVLVVVSNPPPAPPVSRGEGASPLSATRRGVGGEVAPFVDRVEAEMAAQLAALPMAETARAALAHGFAVLAPDLDAAIEVCDRLAPEHLEVMTADAANVAARLSNYGALFLGDGSAEVFGDYGAGPNHVLPTGGAARYAGGLSVFTFLRVRTWLRLDGQENAASLRADAAALGRLEGLIAHARAAERRGK
jgi:phosphoribosyl-ATP pyrophosphohydrolase/phosphoribosyl-AMP cyclohydrolase/histidinol dehydrogenase